MEFQVTPSVSLPKRSPLALNRAFVRVNARSGKQPRASAFEQSRFRFRRRMEMDSSRIPQKEATMLCHQYVSAQGEKIGKNLVASPCFMYDPRLTFDFQGVI